MSRWFTSSISNSTPQMAQKPRLPLDQRGGQAHRDTEDYLIRLLCASVALLWFCGVRSVQAAVAVEREPVTLRVDAVNPSAEKTKTVPVRIDLPQEVTPKDILERGDLSVEYDDERSLYYVFKPQVTLAPKQTRVFEVLVRDVWFVPDGDVAGLKAHTNLLLQRLQSSEYFDSAKQLGDSIFARLEEIRKAQADETIARKQRIGSYRRHLLALKDIKDDLARMEKLLTFAGGPPVPEMLEESPLKSDAPSTTTTWLVIFLIVIFMGLLAGQFFFTWQRRVKSTVEFSTESSPGGPSGEGMPNEQETSKRG